MNNFSAAKRTKTKKMKKKTYIEPTAEALTLDLIALMAGSIKDVDSEDIDQEVSGGHEPAHSKEAVWSDDFWNSDTE